MIKLFSAAAAALALASAAVPMQAAADQVWRVGEGYVVRYHDLDLSTAEGRAALLARVEEASDRACQGRMLRVEERACRERATRTALASTAAPARRALQMAMNERASTTYASR